MNPAPWSLRSTIPALARSWHEFFHRPCDARICAAARIAYATLVLIHLAVLYPDLDLWFGEHGVLPREAAREAASPYTWSLLDVLPASSTVLHACFWIAVGHAVALLVGLWPRLNALLLFVWIASFQVRNVLIGDGEDALMRMLGFFMILLPSGRCWSVSALVGQWWYGQRRDSTHRVAEPAPYAAPGWGLRLLQIEMAMLMFTAGLLKLSGDRWVNGTALYYVSRLDDHFGRFPVPAWLFDSPWLVALMTWSVIAAELAAPVLIWFRETRLACLAVLVAFHLANEWTMNLFLFHWLMLCGWMAFLTPDEFPWLWRKGRLNSGQTENS
jgi:vitamin K-dependent gamma-carboxylase-like protein